jgi:hypothetical protein
MLNIDPSISDWRKSSFSNSGNCVEVATLDESVLVRDSNGNESILHLSSSAWQTFIQMVKSRSII